MRDLMEAGKRRIANDANPTTGNGNPKLLRQNATSRKKRFDSLGQKERLFLTIARHTNDVMMVANPRGRILYSNRAGGSPRRDNGLGKNASVVLSAASGDLYKQALDESMATNKSVVVEHAGPKSTWWLTRFIPVGESHSSGPAVVIICTDITRHAKMERQFVQANRALRVVGRCNEILVRSADEEHFLNDTCKAIVEVEGYNLVWVGLSESDRARTVRPVAHAGFEDGYLETVNITWGRTERGKGPTGTAIRTGKPQVMRDTRRDPKYEPWRKEALKRGYASSVALPMICEEQVIGALNVYSNQRDAFGPREVELLMELASDLAYGIRALRSRAERNHLALELEKREDKLKALTLELALAEERERRRIADGLHDDIAQRLAAAKLELQRLGQAASDPDISSSLGRLRDRVDEMLKNTRSLTFELSSPLLYSSGLSAAVKSYLKEHVQKKHGVHCDFVSNLYTLSLDLEVRITLFQSVRELLTNVIKHAKAGNVKVTIHETAGDVQIVVEDDGIGFETAETLEPGGMSLPRGFGLFNIREHVEYLGGSFNVLSAPGEGTRITVTTPKKYSVPR